jgi:hypothetical protein
MIDIWARIASTVIELEMRKTNEGLPKREEVELKNLQEMLDIFLNTYKETYPLFDNPIEWAAYKNSGN